MAPQNEGPFSIYGNWRIIHANNKEDVLPDGTTIQIEDWSSVYEFYPYGHLLVVYPKSKTTLEGQFKPKLGKTFRCAFKLNAHETAFQAYNELLKSNKRICD